MLAGCIRRENSASRVAHGGRPILQAWAMVCGTAASPREGDAREAALLGWWDSRPGSRVRRRTSYAWSSFSSRNLVEAPNRACILLPRSAHAGVLLRTTGGSKNPYRGVFRNFTPPCPREHSLRHAYQHARNYCANEVRALTFVPAGHNIYFAQPYTSVGWACGHTACIGAGAGGVDDGTGGRGRGDDPGGVKGGGDESCCGEDGRGELCAGGGGEVKSGGQGEGVGVGEGGG